MTPFTCPQCGRTVFFENSRCEACGCALGYRPATASMEIPGVGPRACRTLADHGFCNWLIEPEDANEYCASCRLTRVLPDLSVPGNAAAWQKIEHAKKRLLANLALLGPLPEPRSDANPRGLAFEFLHSLPDEPVLTGHAEGIITLNIAEADDVTREANRVAFNEPVRSLLGHLRHEVAHYLQYRWLAPDEALMAHCREVFGNERADYATALAHHHDNGPPADWPTQFISAYASAHPWEDWAETCAHVLLVIEAIHTAAAWGLRLTGPAAIARPANAEVDAPVDTLVLEHWLPVAQFLNAMQRSLGLPDAYPYLIPDAVLAKMKTVQELLAQASATRA